jgi:AcrR family transcriptional regulator
MSLPRRQQDRSAATRDALLAAARRLFTERGYAAVPAEDIVAAAGLTRGALQHHFGGKALQMRTSAVMTVVHSQVTERGEASPRQVRRSPDHTGVHGIAVCTADVPVVRHKAGWPCPSGCQRVDAHMNS